MGSGGYWRQMWESRGKSMGRRSGALVGLGRVRLMSGGT